MSIRNEPIRISWEVWRACWLLGRAESRTADEVVDTLLRQTITERFPQLFEHQKQIDKLEKIVIEGLRPNENQ